MDIKALGTRVTHWDDPVECQLYDPTGTPLAASDGGIVAVSVVGEYSAPAKKYARKFEAKLRQLTRRYQTVDHIPQAEWDALRLTRLAACIVGWRGIESDGDPLPYSEDNAAVLVRALDASCPDVVRQIEACYSAHSSFFTSDSST